MHLFWFGVVWSKHNRALGKTSVVAEGRTGSVPKHTRGCHRKRALVVLRLPCSLAKRVLVAFLKKSHVAETIHLDADSRLLFYVGVLVPSVNFFF